VADGIEKANRIMMPVLFFLFAGLAVYVFTLPGASGGLKYILTLDPEGLRNPRLWVYAFGQAFFSLSVAGNGTVIYGSYLPKDEDIPGSAAVVAFFDTLAALMAACVIIPAMAAGGAELSSGGPGLMFIYLVRVMNGMPGGRILEIVFYVCILFAGLSSIINMYEVAVANLQDSFGVTRVPASVIVHVFGGLSALFIQAIVSQWMDIVSIYICPLGALLAGVMFFWVAGRDFVHAAVDEGRQKPIGPWFYPLSRYVYCAAALTALIAGALMGGIG
jgi:NSS family neurotransmitter:Na+ symporter